MFYFSNNTLFFSQQLYKTPLHLALEKGHAEVAELLSKVALTMQHNEDKDKVSGYGIESYKVNKHSIHLIYSLITKLNAVLVNIVIFLRIHL